MGVAGIEVARRDIRSGGVRGAIALHYDPAIGGYHLRVARGSEVTVDEAIPDRAVAIARFNSQVDLAWRTMWSPTAPNGSPAEPTDDAEVLRAINRAMAGPPTAIGEELFG